METRIALSKSGLENTDYSLNPYVGCSHACVYCYAPFVLKKDPLEWKNTIIVKKNLPEILSRELPKKRGSILIGSVTDAYQPCEEIYEITRKSLIKMLYYQPETTILTKSDLVLRDLDIISRFEKIEVGFTINTLDEKFKRIIEPNSPSIERILNAMEKINVRKYVMIAPIHKNIMNEIENMFRIFSDLDVSYVIMDRFRYRNGMNENILPYFQVDLKKLKNFAMEISKKYDLKVYFNF